MTDKHITPGYREFDPSTDSSPFQQRLPQLPESATDRERELAAKYTRIAYALVENDEQELGYEPDATNVWFCIGNQAFSISPKCFDTRDEASWFCWMFSKALAAVIDAEGESK